MYVCMSIIYSMRVVYMCVGLYVRLCMCLCVYVYACVCMYVCVCICVCVCTWTINNYLHDLA